MGFSLQPLAQAIVHEKPCAIACARGCREKPMPDAWTEKLDTYLDGELPASEMSSLDAHVRSCPDCAASVLQRVQLKRVHEKPCAIACARGCREKPMPDAGD